MTPEARLWRALGALLLLALLALVAIVALSWRTLEEQGFIEVEERPAAPRERPVVTALDRDTGPAQGETRLEVRVVDPAGQPVPGLQVEAVDTHDYGVVLAEGRADGRGVWRVTLERPALVDLRVPRPWMTSGDARYLTLNAPEQRAELVVFKLCRVDLEVRDPEGEPLALGRHSLQMDHEGRRVTHSWVELDAQGRGWREALRCGPAELWVRSAKGARPPRFWRVPVELVDGEVLLIELSEESPPPPPAPEVPRRSLSVTLDCVDCPAWLSCRAKPDPDAGLHWNNERYCEGGPHEWTCDCPAVGVSLWGTWLDWLTENGVGEPLGEVPADVESWSLSVPSELASLRGRWGGGAPCGWRLEIGEVYVASGECEADRGFEATGLRPGRYTLELSGGWRHARASQVIELAPGEDLDVGTLNP
ncbi:MAG: hypothetical protein H6740_16380 [Alphaproteobacteria bacterium]|nr:hypothetical protein [Alphaproteobacteria bacterium]